MRGAESMMGYDLGGSKTQDYLKGGSVIQIGGKPYTVYEVNPTDTNGQGTIYMMVPAKYENMPKGTKGGNTSKMGKKGNKKPAGIARPEYDPKIDSTSPYNPQDTMRKYFGGSTDKNIYKSPATQALKPEAGLPKYLPTGPQQKTQGKK